MSSSIRAYEQVFTEKLGVDRVKFLGACQSRRLISGWDYPSRILPTPISLHYVIDRPHVYVFTYQKKAESGFLIYNKVNDLLTELETDDFEKAIEAHEEHILEDELLQLMKQLGDHKFSRNYVNN